MERSHPKSYFIDIDGVLMRGAAPIPGAADFVGRLEERGAKFLLLTNNSMYTPRALQLRFENSGLRVPLHRLAQILGHDSLDTTMVYVRGTKGDLQKAVEERAWA